MLQSDLSIFVTEGCSVMGCLIVISVFRSFHAFIAELRYEITPVLMKAYALKRAIEDTYICVAIQLQAIQSH